MSTCQFRCLSIFICVLYVRKVNIFLHGYDLHFTGLGDVGSVPMAAKTVVISYVPCLLDCWYLLNCFRVVFLSMSDRSEISFPFPNLFSLVHRVCFVCRCSSNMDQHLVAAGTAAGVQHLSSHYLPKHGVREVV